MYFAIICLDKANHGSVRRKNRPAHLEHLEAHRKQIFAAGPFLGDDGEQPVGSLLIVEFGDLAAAQAFAVADPYHKAGLFESVTVRPWRKVLP